MKNSLTSISLAVSAIIFLGSDALAADLSPSRYIIGVSPYLSPNERQIAHKEILLLGLESAKPGDQIDVIDAFHNQMIANIKIPPGKQFEKNARARARRLGPDLDRLRGFFSSDVPPESPVLAGAIRLPQFLEFVVTHLGAHAQSIAVIALGSPFYADSRERIFNMVDADFPSDGCLLASRKQTPFGTAEKKDALSEMSLHIAYFRAAFTNDLHFRCVQRFWAVFAAQQGGRLVSFTGDPAVVFGRAARGESKPLPFDPIDPNEKNIRILRVVGERIIVKDEFGTTTSSPLSTLSGPADRPTTWI